VGVPVRGAALVTGNCGFLGRRFARALTAAGWDVDGIDVVNHCDARDIHRWADPEGYGLVVHCAAVVGGRKVIDGDPLAQAVNLELDAALFGWARRARPGRVAYISSSSAYPVSLQTAGMRRRLQEADLDLDGLAGSLLGLPDRLYGWSKLTGEYLAVLAREAGVPVTVVRPFSGYGEDQPADYPFPAFIDRALRRAAPFTIWGDGRQVRDWIHADDIVAATLALCEAGADGPVNLGWGLPVSMTELAALICDAAGYREPVLDLLPDAPHGVAWRVADITRMSAYYQPQVTLADGIARALKRRGAYRLVTARPGP
jgi:nucleoside-diphosphate-sugar epimerase